MKKYLFIAEKPDLMKKVQSVYRKNEKEISSKVGIIDFTSLAGHVCRLLLPNEYTAWDKKWEEIELPMIPNTFSIGEITTKEKLIKNIKDALKKIKYDGIIVGTDSDTEGNGIYYLLEKHLGLEKMEALRFFEEDPTEKGLLSSLLSMTNYRTNPRDIHMTEAYLIRSRMDWLIGMNFSVGFSVKAGFTMRVGRVKCPTLWLVYKNSKEIEEFTPHTDYELQANYKEGFSGIHFNDKGNVRFAKEEEVLSFSKILPKVGVVRSVIKKKTKTNAPQLYKLADVQIEAGKQFGYNPTKCLDIIQSLYETHAIVSYPRTDGRYISTEKAKEFPYLLKAVAAIPELKSYVEAITAADIETVKKDKRIVNDAEVKKASHDALLPTGKIPDISKLSEEEYKILTLIYKRLLSLFLPPLEEEKTVIVVNLDDNDFKTNGKVVINRGWTVLYNKKLTDMELPVTKEGDTIHISDFKAVEKTTIPPVRLTQTTLLEAMENMAKYVEDKELKGVMKEAKGIGMPSSRGRIIDDLLSSNYMEDKKGLYITTIGKKYIESIQDFSIVKPELTAKWETKMQHIKEGSVSYEEVEKEMLQYVKDVVKEIEHADIKKTSWNGSGATEFICPTCGKPLLKGKFGWYCSGRKENHCSFNISAEIASKKVTEKNVKDLLEKGITKEISGFKSKEGKLFSAKLKLLDGEIKFAFTDAEPQETKGNYQCPCCGADVVSEKWAWACKNHCGFSLNYKIADRVMKETDLKSLILNKKTNKLNGFVSKKGAKFSATLVLNKDGKAKFDYSN